MGKKEKKENDVLEEFSSEAVEISEKTKVEPGDVEKVLKQPPKRIPLLSYLSLKGIKQSHWPAYQAYCAKRHIIKKSVKDWDDFFKDF